MPCVGDESLIRPGERLDSLQYGGLRILQRPDGFCFGTDAVLLADFAAARAGDRVVDMGTGTGVIAILIASRQSRCAVDAIEIQPDMADMAARSVALKGMESAIRVTNCDFRMGAKALGYERFSLAVCNPPYGKAGGGLISETDAHRIARHESGDVTVNDVAASAFSMLKTGGRLCVVFPAARAFEMMCAMRENRLEPKRVRTVHATAFHAPKLMLIEAVKFGGSMLKWLPPLIMYREDGTPTDELKRIYRTEL